MEKRLADFAAPSLGGGTKEFATITDALRSHAEQRPDQNAFVLLGLDGQVSGALTYAGLYRRALDIAAELGAGQAGERRALLIFPSGLDFISALFGCLLANVVAAPAPSPEMVRPNTARERFEAIANDAEASLVLAPRSIVDALPWENEAGTLAAARWLVVDEVAATNSEPMGQVDESDVAVLQYTSGSTGSPKGITLQHTHLVDQCRLLRAKMVTNGATVQVGWVPLFHDMGLFLSVMHSVYVGMTTFFMSPVTFVRKPVLWLKTLSDLNEASEDGTISGGATFGFGLCTKKATDEEVAALSLSNWRCAFPSAEPVRASIIDAFSERFAPTGFKHSAFTPGYGLAEGTCGVTFQHADEPAVVFGFDREGLERGEAIVVDEGGHELVSSGKAADNATLVIADPETYEELPEGRIGEIWLQGPGVAIGYYKRPEDNAEIFGARLSDNENTGDFLRTGDYGFLLNGDIFITGRAKDLIIIRGRNLYPQDIEATVEEAHPAVRIGCTAAVAIERDDEERLGIALEIREDVADDEHEEIRAAVSRAVNSQHGVRVEQVVLLPPRAIPKTSSGKIQRQASRELFDQPAGFS